MASKHTSISIYRETIAKLEEMCPPPALDMTNAAKVRFWLGLFILFLQRWCEGRIVIDGQDATGFIANVSHLPPEARQ